MTPGLGRVAPKTWEHVDKYPMRRLAAVPEVCERTIGLSSAWRRIYDQGPTSMCVGFSSSIEQSLSERRTFDPRWLYARCKALFGRRRPGTTQPVRFQVRGTLHWDKMVRIHAAWIAACVMEVVPLRNRTNQFGVQNPMGQLASSLPIPVRIAAPLPDPTARFGVNHIIRTIRGAMVGADIALRLALHMPKLRTGVTRNWCWSPTTTCAQNCSVLRQWLLTSPFLDHPLSTSSTSSTITVTTCPAGPFAGALGERIKRICREIAVTFAAMTGMISLHFSPSRLIAVPRAVSAAPGFVVPKLYRDQKEVTA